MMESEKQQVNSLAMMTAEMRWHFRGSSEEGVESVDFHPTYGDLNDNGEELGRFCTAGLDGVARIWSLRKDAEDRIRQSYCDKVTNHDYGFIKLVASLERSDNSDSFACFTTRWSPCGGMIATCYSDNTVKIWAQDYAATAELAISRNEDDEAALLGDVTEKWKAINTFLGPVVDISEIVDVNFTRDSTHVCFVCNSGAVMVYNILRRTQAYADPDCHNPNALGLTIDPLGLMFATTGSDTRLRFFDTTGMMKVQNSNNLESWSLAAQHNNNNPGNGGKNVNMMMMMNSAAAGGLVCEAGTCFDAILGHAGGPFFRRSSWSPDGAIAAFPFGKVFLEESKSNNNRDDKNNNSNNKDDEDGDDQVLASDSANNNSKSNNNNSAARGGMMMMMMMNNTRKANNNNNNNNENSIPPKTTAIKPPGSSDCITSSVVFVLRQKLNRVASALTIKDTTAVAGCRFAPRVFEPFEEDKNDIERAKAKGSWGPLLYRYALAVWTSGTVMIFTSDCSARHSSFSNLHYAKINDVAWTPRCRILAVASEDQTVSLLSVGDTFGTPVIQSFREIQNRLAPHAVPPLLLIAATMTEQLRNCAEANEAAICHATDTSKKGTNKPVVIKKKTRRDRPEDNPNTAAEEGKSTANNNNNTAVGGANNNNDATNKNSNSAHKAPPAPQVEATADDFADILG